MHGGLQHVHSSSMGIQRAHIGCESHSDERGSGRGRRKSKTIAVLADRVRNSGLWKAVDVKRPQLLARSSTRLAARPSVSMSRPRQGDCSVEADEAYRHVVVKLNSRAA